MAIKRLRGLRWLGGMARGDLLAFVPAAGLAGYWYGVAGALLVIGAALSVAWLARDAGTSPAATLARDAAIQLPDRAAAVTTLDAALAEVVTTNRATAAFVLGIDDAEALLATYGDAAYAQILRRTGEQLQGVLREGDLVAYLGQARFAVVLMPVRRADLESVLQIATRLQAAAEVPQSIETRAVYLSAHVGFCLVSRAPASGGSAMLDAAETAADEALRQGPGSIRAYSSEIARATRERSEQVEAVSAAQEDGKIVAYFLPQIRADTGDISGFELVPRWLQADADLPDSAAVLAAVQAAGLRARLGEVLLYHGFSAARGWATAGLPAIALTLPLSLDELRNPQFPDRLKWELDRFEFPPARLRLLVPEAAATDGAQEMVARTLAALARLGCAIELAGFGDGPAPIAALRRYAVQRLRIQRSFITRVDADPEAQSMVAAILSLAAQLGLETLADGVASIGEHAMLAQLGCGHLQGPVVARAMAFEDTQEWITRHRGKLQPAPPITRRKR